MDDLRQLARFDDRLSFLYVEHARIDQCEKAIAVHDAAGSTPVPVASLALLMLGPGTSITHAAVQALADNNCLVAWVGEEAVRYYAHGTGGTRSSRNLQRQATLWADADQRIEVVKRMYRRRFEDHIDPGLTLQQLRGKEGVRVREAYARASEATGILWSGRSYQRGNWSAADPVNRALSTANACLYGVVHAALVSAGYSAALGFIHTGKQLSFVYDIADLYKVDITIPLAFEVAGSHLTALERSVRQVCRDRFRDTRLVEQILPDIAWILDLSAPPSPADESAYDEDQARPGPLWSPAKTDPEGTVEGGLDYGDSDS